MQLAPIKQSSELHKWSMVVVYEQTLIIQRQFLLKESFQCLCQGVDVFSLFLGSVLASVAGTNYLENMISYKYFLFAFVAVLIVTKLSPKV